MAQFARDDVILYGSNGVCHIDDIEERETGAYYTLSSVHKRHTKFMVPVDNEHLVSRMRPLPEKQTVLDAIDAVKDADVSWIKDNDARRTRAREIIDMGSMLDLLVLEKTFALHKQKVTEIGKRSTSSDSSILRNAQEHIRDVFSVVLGIEPDEVDAFIASK
ncbi:MAG: CarD family transcriptional regulator [Denitrobacterium sp.]|jgi:CarD family transcriptional regulator|nr:CarD family transcriptional regulator [Denitrobacterium sp.]